MNNKNRLRKKLRRLVRKIRRVLIEKICKRSLPYQENAVDQLLRYVNLEGKTLLLIGLGRGIEIPIFLVEGCRKIVSIEPYPIIDKQFFGPQFELVKAFGEAIPLKAETFDVAYSLATLEHVHDPKRVIQEMMRLLKPSGILYCNTVPLWFSAYGYHAKKHFPDLYDPWFHLVYSKEDYVSRREDIKDDTRYLKRLDDIYNHPGYNRLPSQVYYDIVIDLIKCHFPLEIRFTGISQGITRLTQLLSSDPFLYEKLKSFDLRDLVTSGVIMVVQKKGNSL